MSNKKNTNKKTNQKPQANPKKSVNGIVIAAVAVLIAAAVAVAVFLVKKNDKTDPPTTNPLETLQDYGSGDYTYAEYKGTKMPVEFVEILNRAELESYEACQKQGVALKLGDREISVPEFVMYYYDIYYFQSESARYSIQQTGANRTGFDIYTLPGEQKHAREDYMWSEHFTREVEETISVNYMMYDEALKRGVELSNSDISNVFDIMDLIEKGADREKWSMDEEIADTYCEGLTADMYLAREIMVAYASACDSEMHKETRESYSKEKVKAELQKNPDGYSVARLKVYPIEGEYNEAEVAAVSNEKEFLEYANKNHPRDTYDAEFSTECGYITKEKLSSVYGEQVGAWAFEKGRKSGDIALVEGALFRYLVYIEIPAFYATSSNIIFVGTQYDETMTAEDRKKAFEEAEKLYLKWKNEDGTKDGFWEYSTGAGGPGEMSARIGDYQFQIDNWIHDPSRKSGDSVVLDTAEGCCAIYYVSKNENDFDWEKSLREDMATEELKEYHNEKISEGYEIKRQNAGLEDAYDAADISILKHHKRLKEEEKENK